MTPPYDISRGRLIRLVRPVQAFIATESAGSIVLLAASLIALWWANSPWAGGYHNVLAQHVVLDVGVYRLDRDVHFWVNDVAMVVFFFLVGLEIKRELVLGELAAIGRAALPVIAALGGMLVPLVIFLGIARGADARAGWGVPMATDIAFALGVLRVVGRRAPSGLYVLLLAIAIFDDIGAIVVIAVFYTESLHLAAFGAALGVLALMPLCHRAGVRLVPVYVLLGVLAWVAMFQSGVHPTIVGVAIGLLTPTAGRDAPARYTAALTALARRFTRARALPGGAQREATAEVAIAAADASRDALSPLDRMEHALLPWVAFLVVPLFALANAGVALSPHALREALGVRLTYAVAVALFVGKPLGILIGAWLATRLGARLPSGVHWRAVFGMGIVAGIGFTVSIFVAGLAYADAALFAQAKIGIFAATVVASVGGFVWLRWVGAAVPATVHELVHPAARPRR